MGQLADRIPILRIDGRGARRRSGFSLVELLCALTVLLISVLGFTQAITASARTNQQTREKTLAMEAARRVIEEVESNVFAEDFWRYNQSPADDPSGVGTAQGGNFVVPGLCAMPGDPDGMVGEIVFPTRVGFPGALREDVVNERLGMPRDLNGDDVIDAGNHAGDYRLLPLLVRVRWRGAAGNASVELRTILGNY